MDNITVNLQKMFFENKQLLPDIINESNIIYMCKNIITNKVYIGQTKQTLYNRWSQHKKSYLQHYDNILYNAFYKYGLENFEISILENNIIESAERDQAEIKWIKYYDSYNNGYNMTTGGKVMMKEIHKKIIQSNKENHKGQLSWNTKEVRQRALETNKRNHNGVLSFNTPESREKAKQTMLKKYGCLYFHLPYVIQKSMESNRANHNGVLSFNTPEAIKKAQENAPKARIIGNIIRHINFLKENNIEINSYNYIYKCNDIKRMWQQHIPNVLKNLDILRMNKKWSDEMENIFSKISYNNYNKGIHKIIINN